MSHWIVAKEALNDLKIARCIPLCLRRVLSNGCSFQKPDYPPGYSAIEIITKEKNLEKSLAFATATRVMGIDHGQSSGLTSMVLSEFHTAIREGERLLTDASNITPEKDRYTGNLLFDHSQT
jgi:hypothetical protein